MTPRSLFTIILKVLGLFFIKEFIAMIPPVLSVTLYFSRPDAIIEAVVTLVMTLLMLLAYGLVSYYLVFKTEKVIDKLKLDQGFEENIIPLNIHRSTILSIAIIVIGGYMVAEEIPNFCRQLFGYFQEKRLTHGQTNPSLQYSIISVVKIIIGYVLMAEQRQIVNLIERKRKEAPLKQDIGDIPPTDD